MNENDLPAFEGVPQGLRRGRSPHDGYARGWGLEFGGLRELIRADALYQEALGAAGGRTILSESNRMNLYLLVRFYAGKLPMGHVVEFGAYKGGNAIFMAWLCRSLHPGMQVFAFDTFAGMPVTDRAIDAHKQGDFADVDYDELVGYTASLGLSNLHFVRGLFEETAPAVLPRVDHVRINHVDCDIRSAVKYAYETSGPYMVQGGYTVFDDALFSSCIGATEVVEEYVIRRDGLHAEQVYPHLVFRSG